MLCSCYLVCSCMCLFFFFKQKTAYEMRISDWSSDVCSSDLVTSNKYMATPRGTFELKYFFTAAIAGANGTAHSAEAVRHRIRVLIDAENGREVQIGRASCRERVCQYV